MRECIFVQGWDNAIIKINLQDMKCLYTEHFDQQSLLYNLIVEFFTSEKLTIQISAAEKERIYRLLKEI